MTNYAGDAENNTFTGGVEADFATGGAGADVLSGDGGADWLVGNAGADTLTGGDGDDLLFASDGPVALNASFTDAAALDMGVELDSLSGGAGDDRLYAGYGDNADGGTGADTLFLSLGGMTSGATFSTAGYLLSPRVLGGGTIMGFEVFGYLRGTEFNDTLTLGHQSTVITVDGGAGNDLITATTGAVAALGGAGDDTFVSGTAADSFDGGSGRDTIDYSAFGAGVSVNLSTGTSFGGDQLTSVEDVIGTAFADTFTLDGADNRIQGGGGVDTVSYAAALTGITVSLALNTAQATGAGSDTLTQVENLTGSAFDDVLGSSAGANVLNGGSGSDTVSYASAGAAVTVFLLSTTAPQDTGGGGSDTLISIENLIGSSFSDTLIGNTGGNRLDGGAGDDNLYGGVGADIYVIDSTGDLIFEDVSEGVDTAITTVSYYLFDNVENLTLAGGAGSIYGVGNVLGNIITGNEGANLLIGGGGGDTLSGGAGNDTLFGEVGDDVINGDAGDDYLAGGSANDTMNGGVGDDLVYGESGDDTLNGGDGVDFLAGGSGLDTLNGGEDADNLYGEDGNDTLTGGTGFFTDILVGGSGNDTLFGNSGLGDYDLMDGGVGNDTYYVDTPDDLTFEAVGGGTDTVQANIVGAGYYLYANVENIVLLGSTPFGVGNSLNNTMTGSGVGNYLLGGAGDDLLNGKSGNDVLFGEAGADTFIFERGTGGDVIGDFEVGIDHINLSAIGFTSFSSVQANMIQNGNVGAINLGGGDFIILHNVTMSALTASDFIL